MTSPLIFAELEYYSMQRACIVQQAEERVDDLLKAVKYNWEYNDIRVPGSPKLSLAEYAYHIFRPMIKQQMKNMMKQREFWENPYWIGGLNPAGFGYGYSDPQGPSN